MPFIGVIDKQLSAHRSVDGILSTNGNLASVTAAKRAVGGVLSFTGNLSAMAGQVAVYGILGVFRGTVSLIKNGIPVGVAKAIGVYVGAFKKGVIADTVRRWIKL